MTGRRRLERFRVTFATILLAVPLAMNAHSAILTVTSLLDDGSPGTLRATIGAANPGDEIVFAVTGTINLDARLVLGKALTITGPGVGVLALDTTPAPFPLDALFLVESDADVLVSDLTLRAFAFSLEAGIDNSGALTLARVDVDIQGNCLSNNGSIRIESSALFCGGAGAVNAVGATLAILKSSVELTGFDTAEAGLTNDGTVSIVDSSLRTHFVKNRGSLAMQRVTYKPLQSDGGTSALRNSGDALLERVEMLDAIGYYVAIENTGTLRFFSSTLRSANVFTNRAAFESSAGELLVVNSTISGATGQSGFCPAALRVTGGHASVYSTTIAANDGGPSLDVTPQTYLRNVIVADHTGFCGSAACAGLGTLLGAPGTSISDDPSCAGFTIVPDAMLGPLAPNGVNIPTHALLPGSPAIDAVPDGECVYDSDPGAAIVEVALLNDQRYAPRPQPGPCDAGAFEVVPTLPVWPWWFAFVTALALLGMVRQKLSRGANDAPEDPTLGGEV